MPSRWLLALLLALAVGCSQFPDVPLLKPPPKGQTFTVGLLGLPQTVLSTVGQSPQEAEISANLYRPLFDYDESWKIVPVLALDPPTSRLTDENRSITTKLRGTYLWSDGTPVQGNDFETALHLAGDSARDRLEVDWSRSIERVTMQQGILTAHLRGFWPSGGLAIVPFPSQISPELKTNDPTHSYGRKPLSSGPYVITEWVGEGRLITLVPNKNFPWEPAARPIPTIRFRCYDEIDRMVRGIMAGDIQLAPRVDPAVQAQVKNNKWMQTRWIGTDRLKCVVMRLDSPLLADRAVRRALFGGLRRAQWVRALYPEEAEIDPARSWVPDRVWYTLDVLGRVEEEQSDPAWTLERAGWRGKPRKNGKQTLSFELVYAQGDPRAEKIVERISTYWERIGVEVKGAPVDNLSERLAQRDFKHMALAELPLEPWMSPGQVMGRTGLPSQKNPRGLNYSGWIDDQNEAICYAVERSADDMELKPLLARQQQRFAEEMPLLPLFFVPEVDLVSPQLQGYDRRGFGAGCFDSDKWTYTPPRAGGSPAP